MTPEQIKALRVELGISQRELADRINAVDPYLKTSATTVSRWESGRHTPSPHIQGALQIIAREAGVDAAPVTSDAGTPTDDQAIRDYQAVIAACDRAIAAGGDGDMPVSTAQAIRRLAVTTLRNAYGVEVA